MIHNLVTLLTLSFLEIVLGIDNMVLLSILSGKLPEDQKDKARTVGIALAMVMRIGLLFLVNLIVVHGSMILFAALGFEITIKGLLLIAGGLFLAYKASTEMYVKLKGREEHHANAKATSFKSVIVSIVLMDIVFSLDSVITAVGLANGVLWVMIAAIMIGALVMWIFAAKVSELVEKHPSLKILALSFLLIVGFILVLEGFIPLVVHAAHLKSYMYAMMGFSLFVTLLNIRYMSKNGEPVHLHEPHLPSSK